jgi:hypothetical protein
VSRGDSSTRLGVGVAGADSPFQSFDVFGQFNVEPSGIQQVADSQPDLFPVQRLRHEVVGSKYESPVARRPLFVGSKHDYGQKTDPRPHSAQCAENLEAILPRHIEVQKDNVRFELRESVLHFAGVSQAADFDIHVGQELRHQLDVAGLVVHNQNALTHDTLSWSNAVTSWSVSRTLIRNLGRPGSGSLPRPIREVICIAVKPCITRLRAQHTARPLLLPSTLKEACAVQPN